MSLPPYYSNTVENIRAKDHGYDGAARRLNEYIPRKLKGRRPKDEGTKENPIVLKTEAGRTKDRGDNGKRCGYCISKGWNGLNHIESECFTKKREKKKVKKVKKV